MHVRPEGKPTGKKGPEGWRLVCHNCRHKWPVNAAAKPSGCCGDPKVRIHDTSEPCDFCEEVKDDTTNDDNPSD